MRLMFRVGDGSRIRHVENIMSDQGLHVGAMSSWFTSIDSSSYMSRISRVGAGGLRCFGLSVFAAITHIPTPTPPLPPLYTPQQARDDPYACLIGSLSTMRYNEVEGSQSPAS